MFDAKAIGQVIGNEAFDQINVSSLPKIETMTLLHIWTRSSRGKLEKLAAQSELLTFLEGHHRSALDQACELRIQNPHLSESECLQSAGLPLRL